MTTLQPTTHSGRDALATALADSDVEYVKQRELLSHRAELFRDLKDGSPRVVVIECARDESLDVQALRWMYPGGAAPMTLCPSTPGECFELAQVARKAAKLLEAPVLLLLEDDVAGAVGEVDKQEAPKLSLPPVIPVDVTGLASEEAGLRKLNARSNRVLRGFEAATLNACPTEMGRPEWLVVSYGSTFGAASKAVEQARADSQRVNHLNLCTLWPFPEAAVMRASMGIKHIVIPERNLGQYAKELRRALPDIAVVPANCATGPVNAEVILNRLQSTPRCC